MSVHIHTMRKYCAGAFGVILAAILLHSAYVPTPEIPLVAVTGQATSGGHPLGGLWVVFQEDAPRGFTACAQVQKDGSFRMMPWGNFARNGVAPGTYHVFFAGSPWAIQETPVDPKYRDPGKSDLVVHVGSTWNEIMLTLPVPGRGSTLVQHL
jgi:hypothetical protein